MGLGRSREGLTSARPQYALTSIASVRTSVTSALGVQQNAALRMMGRLLTVATIVEESRRAHRVEGKAAEEGGAISGGHGVQVHCRRRTLPRWKVMARVVL